MTKSKQPKQRPNAENHLLQSVTGHNQRAGNAPIGGEAGEEVTEHGARLRLEVPSEKFQVPKPKIHVCPKPAGKSEPRALPDTSPTRPAYPVMNLESAMKFTSSAGRRLSHLGMIPAVAFTLSSLLILSFPRGRSKGL